MSKYSNEQYMADALKTEAIDYTPVSDRLQNHRNVQLLHAAMGIVTEAGEVLDQLKKSFFYGREIDEVNLKEELGDLFWYMAVMANSLNISFEEAMRINTEKLRARYSEKFSEEAALTRNLEAERKILES